MSTQQFAQSSTTDDVVADTGKRRTSARVPEGKRPNYGPVPLPRIIKKTKTKKVTSTKTSSTNAVVSTLTNQQQQQSSTSIGSTSTSIISEISASYPYIAHPKERIAKVKETLAVYNKHLLGYISDEKVAAKHREAKKLKKGGADKKQVERPDLYATTVMRKEKEILYPEKTIGHLPGIDVGHQFCSRNEMVAVGLHSHWLNGIVSMGKEYAKKEDYIGKGYTFPLAVSVVFSGQYEDNDDNREDIIYTGQGGNDLLGDKTQINDQKPTPGNLALMNSMNHNIPVRFIRGHPNKDKQLNKPKDGFNPKLFTYDGLYQVVSYTFDKGQSNHKVYKFSLKRLEGQPELKTDKVEYKNGQSSNARRHEILRDLAEGQENLSIPVINAIDDATITGFTYTNSLQVPSSLQLPPNVVGCQCKGDCMDSKETCACAKRNGGFPYVQHGGGRLKEAKDVVYECGPNCGCGPDCINRISQRALKYRLEVFRTSNRGWGVKTRDFIPSGAPVCEYIGQLQRTAEMDKVKSNEYIFEIDCEQTMKGIGGRQRRQGGASSSEPASVVDSEQAHVAAADESEPEFCIEAGSVGNVARFINHSCDPNLFVQCVLSSHHDLKLARIVFIAAESIPPKTELAYDYGYHLNSVVDEDGNVQTLKCLCGTSKCRERLY